MTPAWVYETVLAYEKQCWCILWYLYVLLAGRARGESALDGRFPDNSPTEVVSPTASVVACDVITLSSRVL